MEAELPLDVRDAKKVLRAAKRLKAQLAEVGLTPEDLPALEAQIELAKGAGNGGRVSLNAARVAVKKLLGDFRRSAHLACRSRKGIDAEMQKALRMNVGYPDTDELLDLYLEGLDEIVKGHSEALAKRKFKKPQQDALGKAAETFRKAFSTRDVKKEELIELSNDHDVIFAELRTMTSYVRSLGVTALHDDPRRSQFDRVKPAKTVKRNKAVPTLNAAKTVKPPP